jgi:hypothetical protein
VSDREIETLSGWSDPTPEVERQASLTVCDPARKLTVFEASEVLKALGLMDDPKHVELANIYGSKRRA